MGSQERESLKESGWEVLLVRNEQRETVGVGGQWSLWLPDKQSGIIPKGNKGATTLGSQAKGYCAEASVCGLFYVMWA